MTIFKKVYLLATKKRPYQHSLYSKNFLKIGIDNDVLLCYIEYEFCKAAFLIKVHISVNQVTYNKVAFFVCPDDTRHCIVHRGIRTTSHADTPCQRYVRGLIAVIRDLIATPRPRMTLWRCVAMLWRTRASVSVTFILPSRAQRHVRDLIAVVRNPIAVAYPRMTSCRRVALP